MKTTEELKVKVSESYKYKSEKSSYTAIITLYLPVDEDGTSIQKMLCSKEHSLDICFLFPHLVRGDELIFFDDIQKKEEEEAEAEDEIKEEEEEHEYLTSYWGYCYRQGGGGYRYKTMTLHCKDLESLQSFIELYKEKIMKTLKRIKKKNELKFSLLPESKETEILI